jgi:general secretion pathway protein C
VLWVAVGAGFTTLLMWVWLLASPGVSPAGEGMGAPVARSPLASTDWVTLYERSTPAADAPAVAAPTPLDGRLRLLGLAGRPGGNGVAVLSLDGQPPRAYRVGDAIEPGWEVRAVRASGVQVARAGGAVAFEMTPVGPPAAVPGLQPALPPVRPAEIPTARPSVRPSVRPAPEPGADTVEPAAEPAEEAAESMTAEGPPPPQQAPGRLGLVAR